jgi:phage tail-like protein
MSSYFESKLFELLPPLYRIEDETGDLAAFLKVPAVSLDELKELIERFPEIFDVDRCEPRYLPYLAHMAGRPYDGTIATETQRNIIKEAVPLYRRKATIPAIRRSLVDLGPACAAPTDNEALDTGTCGAAGRWEGMIEETYRTSTK